MVPSGIHSPDRQSPPHPHQEYIHMSVYHPSIRWGGTCVSMWNRSGRTIVSDFSGSRSDTPPQSAWTFNLPLKAHNSPSNCYSWNRKNLLRNELKPSILKQFQGTPLLLVVPKVHRKPTISLSNSHFKTENSAPERVRPVEFCLWSNSKVSHRSSRFWVRNAPSNSHFWNSKIC